MLRAVPWTRLVCDISCARLATYGLSFATPSVCQRLPDQGVLLQFRASDHGSTLNEIAFSQPEKRQCPLFDVELAPKGRLC